MLCARRGASASLTGPWCLVGSWSGLGQQHCPLGSPESPQPPVLDSRQAWLQGHLGEGWTVRWARRGGLWDRCHEGGSWWGVWTSGGWDGEGGALVPTVGRPVTRVQKLAGKGIQGLVLGGSTEQGHYPVGVFGEPEEAAEAAPWIWGVDPDPTRGAFPGRLQASLGLGAACSPLPEV